MEALLGIDLGTSSVKTVILAPAGQILAVENEEYPISTPSLGFAEQDPGQWYRASAAAVRRALAKCPQAEIGGIGFSGQMHGGVLLDESDQPVAPAIIWPDQRSAGLLDEITSIAGREALRQAGTAPAAGFMISTLFWLSRNNPALLKRAKSLLFPKDYVRFRMTGQLGVEITDAAASGLFDVGPAQWSETLIEKLKLPPRIFLKAKEASAVAGTLTSAAAQEFGLVAGVPVVCGAADQPAQALANGLIDPGLGSVTVGTGGQVFLPLDAPKTDALLRLHTFNHAVPGRWYSLGAMLAAGLALRWLKQTLQRSFAEMDQLASEVPAGSEGLVFLPYLAGERSPILDPRACGAFVGLTLRHGPGHLARAVMEGVAFGLRQIIEAMAESGAPTDRFIASGNGLGSPLWRQLLSDVLNRPLCRGTDQFASERAGMGAALLAGVGSGQFAGFGDLPRPTFSEITEPRPAAVAVYDAAFARFSEVYPALKAWFGSAEQK